MIHYLLVLCGFLIDGIINILFPSLFVPTSMYFVPCIGFCAMIVSIRKMNTLDSYLLCMISGIIYDYFYANTLFVYFILYIIICFITKLWTKQINDSLIENILLCISTIFLREVLIYLYMHISNQTQIDFSIWLTNRMFLTLLINAILVSSVVFISYAKDDYLRRKEIKQRREEKLPWMH